MASCRVSARRPTYFLCFAKESRQRKATRRCRPGRWPDCSAVLGLCSRAQLAAFALLTALKQGARSQSTRCAARTAAKSCAPRRPPRGIDSARCALPGQYKGKVVAGALVGADPAAVTPMRSEACGARSRERTARSAGSGGRARSAPQKLTSRSLSERSGQRPRSEFCASPPNRAPQRTPGKARGAAPGSPFFAPFLWRLQRKGVGCRAETRHLNRTPSSIAAPRACNPITVANAPAKRSSRCAGRLRSSGRVRLPRRFHRRRQGQLHHW
jgi:hypothetical protein